MPNRLRRSADPNGAKGRTPSLAPVVFGILILGFGAVPASAQDQAPDPRLLCPEEEARAFDFWIGEWEVLNRNRRPDGVRFHETGRATNRVYPVVGGCGIVEHWRGHAFGRFIVGFSVRSWDPAAGEWLLVLLWPTTGSPSFGELRGGFRHGRGEFSFRRETAEGDTAIHRFTFSDIRRDAFRWENATSRDGGVSWEGSWIMEFTRRDRVAGAGLWNGPSVTARRCPAEEHRRLDRYLGEWRGTRLQATGDSLPVTFHLVPILEGCAVMERARSADGRWEAFRVRAYEPETGRWVEYALDAERRTLRRREAEPGSEALVFRDLAPGPDGRVSRTRWEADPEGAPVRVVEEATGPDGPWTRRAVVRLGEPLGAPFRP